MCPMLCARVINHTTVNWMTRNLQVSWIDFVLKKTNMYGESVICWWRFELNTARNSFVIVWLYFYILIHDSTHSFWFISLDIHTDYRGTEKQTIIQESAATPLTFHHVTSHDDISQSIAGNISLKKTWNISYNSLFCRYCCIWSFF